MGRKAVYTETELLDATEKLLITHGYEGFHLKLLSEHVNGARSTIYQYYANKEELIAACVRRAMQRILKKIEVIDETDVMEALHATLRAYIDESKLHQILSVISKVKGEQSANTQADIAYVKEGHELLREQLYRLMTRAQQEEKMRQDIPIAAVLTVFFTFVDVPNTMGVSNEEWTNILFKIWLEGVKLG